MKDNKHQTAIPEAVIEQVRDKITAIKADLAPYLIALTPAERHAMLKMGDKSLAFVEKTHDYAHDNPNLVPSYLNMAAFDDDFKDAHGLWTVISQLRQLEEGLEDTIMSAGSEAFHAALAVYHNVQAAAKDDVPGAKAIAEDLKGRFPGGRKRASGAEGGDSGAGGTETETVT